MIGILCSFSIALLFTLAGTPMLIKFLARKSYGQFVREDGPMSHQVKHGTPTMGGVVFVVAVIISYFTTHFLTRITAGSVSGISISALLALFLIAGMGFIGFLDDWKKISHRRSLGLKARWKIILQSAVGVAFALLVLEFPDENSLKPASTFISFTRDIPWLNLVFLGPIVGTVLFVAWANFIITAVSNGVNLTDGLDGLAAGASLMIFAGYGLINFWQVAQACGSDRQYGSVCYSTRDPLDLAVVSAAFCGALIGFLWWNASPAKIFMGDTGSLAIGGGMAAMAILTRTELLFVVLGGLFVVITLSVILQVVYFRISGGKRIFKMAPLQHHFELKGWNEVTVVIRFWIVCAIFVAIGLGIFYTDWVLGIN